MAAAMVVSAIGWLMMAIERWRPANVWPRVAGWWTRTALLTTGQTAAVWLAGVAWDGWMRAHRPWSADVLGSIGGALAGYVVITFVYYWWHRARHEVPALWRWLHQVHHSPQRLEVVTAFYKHPLELLLNAVLSSAVLYLLVGLGPVAASGAVLLTGVAELFYHWNVTTPYWLGFLVQRPESHRVHHQTGLHALNYSDLPVWDMLFGTFYNPRTWAGSCGFGDAERRLGSMLLGVDVLAERRR